MGAVGMCLGEKRRIIEPSDMAFGADGVWPFVPPHTPLEWHTQLVRIVSDDEEF